ncbi:4-alpha-glucanotransferase [Cellulosilyticum sp. I15G10I2]|uniref:4-alpha-glucanotransferase n=1 Tax=Cellulosilyticum sp. I15G10I2 TaxID=1892843 RepID=UPI00085C1C27|nr:4-alpha-glucanotransferase [Cellulosilyticum sp. I15G10I2]
MSRASGILMHISSLPEDYGIGTFGEQAFKFADFLKASGQSYWQILPLGHTGYGDSPYQAFSAYAGNPYFIDFKLLEKEGLLKKEDFENVDFGTDETEIDYGKLFENRFKVLKVAYNNGKDKLKGEIADFKETNKAWLEDYAVYMAIKNKMKLLSWQEWDEAIKLRDKKTLEAYKIALKEEIEYWIFVQYQFFKQWRALKAYVNSLGIKIIGDIPIYVAIDSADTWANTELFKLDVHKKPTVVAGCPPDAFSDTGQLWGNPIYDWEYLEQTGFSWWIDRIKESLKLYDVVRIDHFRGFEAYWEIPFGDETAEKGKWVKGPAMKLFDAIYKKLGEVAIIAEDLGYLTQEVIDFRDVTGYPGMKILQFAFDTREESDYLPHNYNKNCIVYTGTHDNDTALGWMHTTGNKKDVEHAKRYLKLDKKEGYHWGFIRGAWSSTGKTAIAPMQDFLGLGNEARMNLPSTLGINWRWRMKKDALTEKLHTRIYELTKRYGRLKEYDK